MPGSPRRSLKSPGKPKDDAAQSTGGKPVASAAVGLDNDNAVLLLRYDLAEAVDPAQLPDHVPELDGIVAHSPAGQRRGQ